MDAHQLPVVSCYNQTDLFRINKRELNEQDSVIIQHQSPVSEATAYCVSKYSAFQASSETINRCELSSYNEPIFHNQQHHHQQHHHQQHHHQQHHQHHLLFNASPQPASEVGLTFFRNGTECMENHVLSYESLPSVEDVSSKGTDINVHLDFNRFPKYESESNNGIQGTSDSLIPTKERPSTMTNNTTVFLHENARFDTHYRYNSFNDTNNVGTGSLETNGNGKVVENANFNEFQFKSQMCLQTKPHALKEIEFEKNPKQLPLLDRTLACCSSPSEFTEKVPEHLQQSDADCLHANNTTKSIIGFTITSPKKTLEKEIDIGTTTSTSDSNDQTNTVESGGGNSNPTNVDSTPKSQDETLGNDNQKKDSSLDCVKPALSYIALIATAILESSSQRLSLGSIYSWIETNYPYYRNRNQGWRNSVRHNLSLNDCFVKAGRCEDGKGNYWAIHPANVQDFMRGDFRQRRRSRRRARKSNPCELNMYPSGYLPSPSELGMNSQTLSTFSTALNPIYSPYTEAERQAYRLDEALLRQTMNSPFVKWYNNPSFSTNANDFKAFEATQWPAYPEKSLHQLGAFSR